MKTRQPVLRACAALVCISACSGPALAAEPNPVTKPPAPPEAVVSAALTNLSRPAPKKDGLKLFEEDVSRSFESFSPKGVFNGVRAPQYRPPPPVIIQTRRPKDDLDWKDRWMFGNSGLKKDDLQFDPFKSSGDSSPKRSTSLDDFFKNLDRQLQKTTSGNAKGPNNPKLDGANPGTQQERPKTLEETLFGTKTTDGFFKPQTGQSSFSSLFGPGPARPLSNQDLQAHKNYVDRFKEILDGPTAGVSISSSANAFGGLSTALTPQQPIGTGYTPPGYTGGYNALEPSRSSPWADSLASSPGSAGSIHNPTVLQDANSRVLNQWNPLYSDAKPELPKPAMVQPPTAPIWEITRRRF